MRRTASNHAERLRMLGDPPLSGPPPKPVELDRLQGNPSHRARQPTILGGRVSESDLAALQPPAGMSAAERRAWREVIGPLVAGGILDRADLSLVELAAQALARARAARALLNREGMTHLTSQGLSMHPAVTIEKGALAEYRQLALQLGIGPSGRARLGRPSGARPDGGMEGEIRGRLGQAARLRVVGDAD